MTRLMSAGSLLYARLVSPAWRMRLTRVLAVAARAVRMLFAFSPNLASALTILWDG